MSSFILFYKFNFAAFANKKEDLPDYIEGKKYTIFENNLDFSSFLDKFLNNDSDDNNAVIIYPNNIKNAIRECLKRFSLIKAAGGIVRNNDNKHLLILRNNRWDLPKGKAEKGETLERTALREVEEETGVGNLISDGLIVKTYHVYYMFEQWIIKQTSWYDMHTSFNQTTVPQTEEGIEQVEWVEKKEVNSRLNNSYAMLSFLIGEWNKKK